MGPTFPEKKDGQSKIGWFLQISAMVIWKYRYPILGALVCVGLGVGAWWMWGR